MGRNNGDFIGGTGKQKLNDSAFNWGSTDELSPTENFKGNPTVVGMVPTHVLGAYEEFDRRETGKDKIDKYAEDMAKNGVTTPLQMVYDHDKSWGVLKEGNHRYRAALQAGITHLPVVVTVGPHESTAVGAPLTLKAGKLPEVASGFHRKAPYFRNAHPSAFQELGN